MTLPKHAFKTLPDGDSSRCEQLIWGVPCGYAPEVDLHRAPFEVDQAVYFEALPVVTP